MDHRSTGTATCLPPWFDRIVYPETRTKHSKGRGPSLRVRVVSLCARESTGVFAVVESGDRSRFRHDNTVARFDNRHPHSR